MKHLTEEELILHYYGEDDRAVEHLDGCESCRRDYHALQRTLNAVDSLPVPERPPDYESRVWEGVAGRLAARNAPSFWFGLPKWAMAAALLIAAFLAGRYAQQHPAQPARGANTERILLIAVGDHLERSQMVLAELTNAAPGNGKLDISYERQAAEDLVETNRLYRQSALIAGDRPTASILDDLERTLLEIAHSPHEVSEKQLEDLRSTIQDQGLQFKVRVFQTQIQERDKAI